MVHGHGPPPRRGPSLWGMEPGAAGKSGGKPDHAGAPAGGRARAERAGAGAAAGGRRVGVGPSAVYRRRRAGVCGGGPGLLPEERAFSRGEERDARHGGADRRRRRRYVAGGAAGRTGGRARPGGVVRSEGLRRDRSRLCGDGAQVAGRDGGPCACAGDAGDGPAHGLCRSDRGTGRACRCTGAARTWAAGRGWTRGLGGSG